MVKTMRKKNSYSNTRKNSSSSSKKMNQFEKEITIKFLEMLMMVKLYHWKTTSYATHKATDELYSSLNEHIDKFIEVLLGKAGNRIGLISNKSFSLGDVDSQEKLKQKIMSFKSYLVGLNNNKTIGLMSNSDLLNIRDEILGDLNQFLYLLTFK
jgi:DNA-binding ferritin-like protein